MNHFEGSPPGLGLRKGAWTTEEDELLKKCIETHGEGKWHQVPRAAGLNRCRKSCRLRWLNYLRPNIHRGEFSVDEVDYIIRLHKLLGNRWSLIAGRLPGRTANDVKNYWNTHLRKKVISRAKLPQQPIAETIVIRPRPRTFSKTILETPSFTFNSCSIIRNNHNDDDDDNNNDNNSVQIIRGKEKLREPSDNSGPSASTGEDVGDGDKQWWEDLFNENYEHHHLASSSLSSWSEEDFPSNIWI